MSRRILVVDDEEDIVETARFLLEIEGFEVVGANSGFQALKMIEQEKFDLIILDIMMPGMSGWDVFSELMKKHKEYKDRVMFLTVIEVSDERKQKLFKEGAIDYIAKPLGIKDLPEKVKKVLK